MHVKLMPVTSLLSKVKLFWDRITLTRITTIYFLFSVLHCVVQVIFQAQGFRINVQAADFLASIVNQGDVLDADGFYVFGNDLWFCNSVPKTVNTNSCQVIWNGTVVNNRLISAISMEMEADSSSSAIVSAFSPKSSPPVMTNVISKESAGSPDPSPAPTPVATAYYPNDDERMTNKRVVAKRSFPDISEAVEINGTVQVVVNGLGWNNESAILGEECLWALGWPIQVLQETKREDITFIMFQIWVLGMSIVAILNESVPHMMASLLTHLVATGWSGFQIFNTAQFRNDFAKVTTNGACHPINLLPTYWISRSAVEIPSLVLNAVALLISVFLSWRLTKSFNWQTFKRIGASLAISRIYKIVLMLSIVIQLSLFFIVTSIALWLDQLWNGTIGRLTTSPVYRPLLIITLLLLPVWLAAGWYSVRRERKIGMSVFLVMCLGYLAGWGAMFGSRTFRWTFMTWTFFGVITTTSVFLTLLSFALGVICRFNFGKGLPHYLNARDPIREDFRSTSDPEKVAFPSSRELTSSAVFNPLAGAHDFTMPQMPPGTHLSITKAPIQHAYDDRPMVIE